VPINPLFRKHFNAACDYFGIEDGNDIEVAHPTTTPFLMKTDIAKSLVIDVETRESESFLDTFIKNTSLNEFYLYFAYLLSKHKLYQSTYVERSRYARAAFGQAADSVERLEQVMVALDNDDICCTGIHRRIFEIGLPENMAMVTRMWQRYRLIENEADAVYFQTFEKPLKHKRFILF
jgi:hypothetical protein